MMHRFSPLLTSNDDMESDDEAPQTPPSLDRRRRRSRQIRSSPGHNNDNALGGKRLTEKHNDRPVWTHSYLSPIDSDVDVDSVRHRRTGHPKCVKGPTKGAPQDTAYAEVQDKHKRERKAKQIRNAYISPTESESESKCDGPQKKRARPRKVKQAQDVFESSDQESKTADSGKEKTCKRQNNKQTNKCITTLSASDPESEVTDKRAMNLKTLTSMKSKERRSTTPTSAASPNHGFSDFEDTAERQGNQKSVQSSERSSDSEYDRSRDSCPEHSDQHTDESDNEVESASLIATHSNKFRKKRKASLKETSSSCESEDDEKKQRTTKMTKRKKQALGDSALDFLDWSLGGSSARPCANKQEGKRKRGGPIECKVCGRSIRCKAIMERHMLTHTGEKPFECDDCGRRYTSSSNLRIHQQSHTGKMDYSCEECGQKFTHLPYLKRHLLRHSGKKLHMCDQCGKGFIQKYHLERHLLVHSGKMPYACDKCSASFNRTDYLSLHMRNVHLSESNDSEIKPKPNKPYKCDVCEKAFGTRTTLEAHGRVHSGITPYSCSVCQRKFKQSSQMHAHMRTHSGEKPHSCDLCGMKFARRNYVKIHKERRHAAKSSSLQSS